MRVLLAHNRYQSPGGEDAVFEDEKRLLREHGNEIIEYGASNDRVLENGPIRAAQTAVWSHRSYQELSEIVRRNQPDIAHFHNTFMMISPSAYYACRAAGVPVVQTLHNFRIACPAATFFRRGAPCEDCLGRSVALPAVLHACYRRSRAQSAVVAAMLAYHRARNTWKNQVSLYVSLTEFSRRKFVEAGLPEERLFVKPNFAFDVPGAQPEREAGTYAVYVGRLSEEKGVRALLGAWKELDDIPLVVVGEGPLKPEVAAAAEAHAHFNYVGAKPAEATQELIRSAAFILAPSLCYENFPRVIVESFVAGRPVVSSRLGAMRELVDHGRTGLLCEPGNSSDLAAQVRRLWEDPDTALSMGREARLEYQSKYTPDRNYQLLMGAYRRAMAAA